jgi:hypothetical protein
MAMPTTGNEILVDSPEMAAAQPSRDSEASSELVSWIMARVPKWEQQRERGYGRRWAEYWRMWRGQWSEEDKNRLSERSRLIAPALAQAIEATVSELEEALLSKDIWFDIVDNTRESEKVDALLSRDLLKDDLDKVNAKDALAEAMLNAAIFGTGIVKVSTSVARETKPTRGADYKMEAGGKDRVFVTVESIRPDEFIPDPAGRSIQEMMGCAQRIKKPLHSVLEKIKSGTYRKDALGQLQPSFQDASAAIDSGIDPQAMLSSSDADQVDVLEYHGKVPLGLLNSLLAKRTSLDEVLGIDAERNGDDGELIEAIVTIANGSTLLRAMANPFVMTDRSVIAFQFEKVPGRFWGRGISEKGYNPQKALDAGVRAWIDALGFVSSPMLGVDSGRIPRGFKLEIKPGKVWLTQGPPAEVLQPVSVGNLDQNLFAHASEMERMVQMGTGAFDSASALNSQSQSGASGLSSNSMMMGSFVKRSKRAVQNVDRNLLQPVIQKAMWRYMQFDPQRYPKDYDFVVKASMGIVAREVEAAQMSQLLGMMPEQFGQVSLTIVQGIVEHSALPNKSQILQQINQALQPPSEEEQAKKKELADLQFEAAKGAAQKVLLENQQILAEIRKTLSDAQAAARKADVDEQRVNQEVAQLQLQLNEIELQQQQNQLQLKKLQQGDRALDIKEAELTIKAKQANRPAAK